MADFDEAQARTYLHGVQSQHRRRQPAAVGGGARRTGHRQRAVGTVPEGQRPEPRRSAKLLVAAARQRHGLGHQLMNTLNSPRASTSAACCTWTPKWLRCRSLLSGAFTTPKVSELPDYCQSPDGRYSRPPSTSRPWATCMIPRRIPDPGWRNRTQCRPPHRQPDRGQQRRPADPGRARTTTFPKPTMR